MGERIVAHVDMDAFYAAIEVRDHPEYRGRPVVVGAGPHARGVVAAASYEARRYGIHSAMASRQAFALCPTAVFLPPDMARYREESSRVFEVLETFTPQIEPVSVDEAFLDLTGCPVPAEVPMPDAGAGSPARGGHAEPGVVFGHAIQQRIRTRRGLPASVGVAPNKFLAKVASELAKPDGVRRITRDAVQGVLDPLPVGALWGVGPETRTRLEARGITTIGALRRTPVSTLRAILGFAAERLAALSRGEDDRPVDPEGEAKSIGREVTFDHDTRDRDLIARTLRAACEDVAHSLRADGLAGRVVTLKARFEPFDTLTRRLTLPAATDHGGRIARAAAHLLRRLEPLTRRMRLVGVTVSGLERPAAAQIGLFETAGAGPAQPALHSPIDHVVDAINERFGAGAVAPARVLEPREAVERPEVLRKTGDAATPRDARRPRRSSPRGDRPGGPPRAPRS
ncbi:MAG TPA: DNA polymerase IV [bacterium]|nr:DNA polymerase IV [bacterium]